MRKDTILIVLGFAVVAAATYFILDVTLERSEPELASVTPDEPPVVIQEKAAKSDKAKELATAGLPPEQKAEMAEKVEDELSADDADSDTDTESGSDDADSGGSEAPAVEDSDVSQDNASDASGSSATDAAPTNTDSGANASDESTDSGSSASDDPTDSGQSSAAGDGPASTDGESGQDPQTGQDDSSGESAESGSGTTGTETIPANVTYKKDQGEDGGAGQSSDTDSQSAQAGGTDSDQSADQSDNQGSEKAEAQSQGSGGDAAADTAEPADQENAKGDDSSAESDTGAAKPEPEPVQYSGEPAKKGDKIVAKGVVNIRAKGTTDSEVVGQLQPGDIVVVTADAQGKWANIKDTAGDKQGWVYLPLFRYPVGAPEVPVAVPE